MKILIAGGHGFIGQAVSHYFKEKGHTVVLLSREKREDEPFWSIEKKEIDLPAIEDTDVAINLVGEPIAAKWTAGKKEKIEQSRVDSTRFLVESLLRLSRPPSLYIGASGIGYYGNQAGEMLTEKSGGGTGFLAEVCQKWEAETEPLKKAHTRVCLARLGVVLGVSGGALKKMLRPFKLGLGGTLGNGQQIMSWVSLDDVVQIMAYFIDHDTLSGPFNVVAPNPVSNAEFTKTLGKTLHRPTYFPVPKCVLNWTFGEGAEALLESCRALPEKLLESGYRFAQPNITECLEQVTSKPVPTL